MNYLPIRRHNHNHNHNHKLNHEESNKEEEEVMKNISIEENVYPIHYHQHFHIHVHTNASTKDRVLDLLSGMTPVRVFCKAKEDFSLTIRGDKVVLAPHNPKDPYQHWIKDSKYSTKVKDEVGLPSFALVNKVTGEAIKHSIGATHPVRLIPYNPDYMDESVLWTESYDTGENYRCIRMANNIRLNFDAFHGDKDHGGVRDGTIIVLWEWLKGENQRWKIVKHCKLLKS